jgi:aspartate aminotransferase-like enzyme
MLKKNFLFTPGPTMVPPEVLAAEAQTMIHHRTPQFSAILADVTAGMKELVGTEHDVFVIAGSGTAAMETAVCNIVSPGDKVVCVQAGKFGERWTELCERYGADPIIVEKEYGQSFGADDLAPVLRSEPDVKAVYITQSETSTGALSDVAAIAALTREAGALCIVDAITGIGIQEFRMDEWGVDIAVTGSQKGLMMSPGLAFIAVGPRVWPAVEACTSPRYYLDLAAMKKSAAKQTTPYTSAVSLVRAAQASLAMMRAEGLDEVVARHARLAHATRSAVQALGLELLAATPANVVTAVRAPEGLDSDKLVKLLRDKYGVTIAGGQGELKGKIFRIGHMGYVGEFDILAAVGALERALAELGYAFEAGAGLAAAQKVLMS